MKKMAIICSALIICGCEPEYYESKWICEGRIKTINGVQLLAEHEIFNFVDGSVMTICTIYSSASEINATNMWRHSSEGAFEGKCSLRNDIEVNSPSWGKWIFIKIENSDVGYVSYDDQWSPHDKSMWRTTCKKV
jgi:hypothetical protein